MLTTTAKGKAEAINRNSRNTSTEGNLGEISRREAGTGRRVGHLEITQLFKQHTVQYIKARSSYVEVHSNWPFDHGAPLGHQF